MIGVLIRKKKLGHRQGENHVIMTRETRVIHLQAKEHQGLLATARS